jgi:hypothetical protein
MVVVSKVSFYNAATDSPGWFRPNPAEPDIFYVYLNPGWAGMEFLLETGSREPVMVSPDKNGRLELELDGSGYYLLNCSDEPPIEITEAPAYLSGIDRFYVQFGQEYANHEFLFSSNFSSAIHRTNENGVLEMFLLEGSHEYLLEGSPPAPSRTPTPDPTSIPTPEPASEPALAAESADITIQTPETADLPVTTRNQAPTSHLFLLGGGVTATTGGLFLVNYLKRKKADFDDDEDDDIL